MASWVHVPEDSDFSLLNLPYGIFSTANTSPRIGIAIGSEVLDLKALAQEHVFDDLDFDTTTLEQATLNAFAGLGRRIHSKVRGRLHQILEEGTQLGDVLRDNQQRRKKCLFPLDSVSLHLPVVVGDYTDFFIGLHHAKNVSLSLRNWKRCCLWKSMH